VRRLLRLIDSDDKAARAAAIVALVVAGNQPFYPAYLYAIAGAAAWPSLLVLATTPAYLTIALAARARPALTRLGLPVVGVANTLIGVKALGAGSGVELFYLPCLLLAVALTRPGERIAALGLAALPVAAYLGLDPLLVPPIATLDRVAEARMVALHGLSVAGLLVVVGLNLRLTGEGRGG
jgi:hypothetical protein